MDEMLLLKGRYPSLPRWADVAERVTVNMNLRYLKSRDKWTSEEAPKSVGLYPFLDAEIRSL